MTQQGAGWRPGRVRVVPGHPSASPSAGPGGACLSARRLPAAAFSFSLYGFQRGDIFHFQEVQVTFLKNFTILPFASHLRNLFFIQRYKDLKAFQAWLLCLGLGSISN